MRTAGMATSLWFLWTVAHGSANHEPHAWLYHMNDDEAQVDGSVRIRADPKDGCTGVPSLSCTGNQKARWPSGQNGR